MSIRPGIHFRCALSAILATVLLTQSSCNISFEHDPARTVTVEITGINEDEDRDEVRATLTGMADGSSYVITSSSSGDRMTVRLSPVEDVKGFSRKINFGNVTEVDGRTVRVEFVK